jgi:hypothetical protein
VTEEVKRTGSNSFAAALTAQVYIQRRHLGPILGIDVRRASPAPSSPHQAHPQGSSFSRVEDWLMLGGLVLERKPENGTESDASPTLDFVAGAPDKFCEAVSLCGPNERAHIPASGHGSVLFAADTRAVIVRFR